MKSEVKIEKDLLFKVILSNIMSERGKGEGISQKQLEKEAKTFFKKILSRYPIKNQQKFI